MAATTTGDAPTKRTRKTTPSEYYLHKLSAGPITSWIQSSDEKFPDADSAIKHVKDKQLEGTFRVVRVVREFSVTKETKTVMKIA